MGPSNRRPWLPRAAAAGGSLARVPGCPSGVGLVEGGHDDIWPPPGARVDRAVGAQVQAAVVDLAQLSLVGTGGIPTGQQWARWLADPATTARFQAKVYRRGGAACWFWVGAISSDGHGGFRAGSRTRATSWVVTAHVFAYQLTHGLCRDRLLAVDVVIRHRCDEASCQNPAHLAVGTATMNAAEYRTRRHRIGGPLRDTRGAAGRARAIRHAILTTLPAGAGATDNAITAAQASGNTHAHQPSLFDQP